MRALGNPTGREAEEDLERRLREARLTIIEPHRRRLDREMELLDDTIDMWFGDELLNPEFPMSTDVFISGFRNPHRDALLELMRANGLRADEAGDNRTTYATLAVYHTRLILWNAERPAPGSFFRIARRRQPYVHGIAVGNAEDETVVGRVRSAGASAFIPMRSVNRLAAERARDTYSAKQLSQCVRATLARTAPICANFAEGRPCLGECGSLEDDPTQNRHESRVPTSRVPTTRRVH
ncbi:hypothetical protein HOK31_00210 [Candidatus Poribacteria bacterium]|nr:hypothetical protein [Candidatus Poribacteria bacterium]